AFPVLIGKTPVALLKFFSETPIEPDASMLSAMASIGTQLGRVVERRHLQEELTDAIWFEQRRFGRELHDSISQELAGISMIAKSLAQKLKTKKQPEAAKVADLAEAMKAATLNVRDLAKGLFPGEIDSATLASALADLAANTQARHGIACSFHLGKNVSIPDNNACLHLFLIAREAVTNAVKHARAKRIDVSLTDEPSGLSLRVRDDGRGMRPNKKGAKDGMGLRIMRYRASLIGALLDVQPSSNGTTVICVLRGGGERAAHD